MQVIERYRCARHPVAANWLAVALAVSLGMWLVIIKVIQSLF